MKKWYARLQKTSVEKKVNFILTVIIACATVVAAFQLSEMHYATIVSQRAWVGVIEPIRIDAVKLYTFDANASYAVNIKNFGPSVALNVAVATRLISRAQDMFPTRILVCQEAISMSNGTAQDASGKFALEHGLGDVLFPAQEENHPFVNQTIEHPELDQTAALFVVGCISYRDQFGILRKTRFSNMYQGVGDPNAGTPTIPFIAYPSPMFNDAD